jgi:hypothetical protein
MQRRSAFVRREKGAVLVVSLVLLLIITAIAASTLTSSTFQTVVSNNAQKRDVVFRAAESAVERVLPLDPALLNSAYKAGVAGHKVTLTGPEQPGVEIPQVKVTYAGDEDGQRQANLKGISLGGEWNYVIRTYEVQGDAKSVDGKVQTQVIAGIAKVEKVNVTQ